MVSRITFSEVNAQPDILDQVGFILDLGNIPLGGGTRHLAIKCTTCPIPGMGNEVFEATMHGHKMSFAGKRNTPGTFSPTFYEDSKGATGEALKKWLEFTRGSESGNSSGYKKEYAVQATLHILDTTGRVVNSHLIENCIIQDIPDVNMDSSSSGPVQVSPTFKYDRIDWNNGNLL